VALTHMRMQNDINLGSQVPEIDIILGHHDHHYEVTPSDPHGTLVGKSGTDYRELRLLKIALGGYKSKARCPATYSSSSACVLVSFVSNSVSRNSIVYPLSCSRTGHILGELCRRHMREWRLLQTFMMMRPQPTVSARTPPQSNACLQKRQNQYLPAGWSFEGTPGSDFR
jgi:hypothetical protein